MRLWRLRDGEFEMRLDEGRYYYISISEEDFWSGLLLWCSVGWRGEGVIGHIGHN